MDKWSVYYCTSIGDIEGVLKIENNKLIFTPITLDKKTYKSHESAEQTKHKTVGEDYEKKNLSQWGAVIQVTDIAECNVMAVPSAACEDHFDLNFEYEKDFLFQIILYGHGQKSMGKYLNDLFADLKGNKRPYANVYFKIKGAIDKEQAYNNKQKQIMAHQLQVQLLEARDALKEKGVETTEHSDVPYFEFMFDNFKKNDAELLRKLSRKDSMLFKPNIEEIQHLVIENAAEEEHKTEEGKKIASAGHRRTIIPKINGESEILNLEQFTQLINSASGVYQTLEWQKIYSLSQHGTSFLSMLRATEQTSPSIIVIKDENDFVFGAYCADELYPSQDYYGTGETFLFSFRDLDEVSLFFWSKKNNLLINVSDDGIMFGGKPHYGLWLNNELTQGRSYECETFDSPMLSYKNDFDIMKLEVWSVINPFVGSPKKPRLSISDQFEPLDRLGMNIRLSDDEEEQN